MQFDIFTSLALVAFALIFLKFFAKLTCGATKSNVCLIGKTALVTGGNAGIGYRVALALASRGATVIIADKDDSEESCQKIIKATDNEKISWRQVDLASFDSIRQFAKNMKEEVGALDILVNNAGIGTGITPLATEDGFSRIFQVNLLGPFLLTYLMVDLLKKSTPSRIVFVSSIMSFLSNLKPEKHLFREQPTSTLGQIIQYDDTKLCNILISDEFGRRLKQLGITCNSCHPGVVYTDIYKPNYKGIHGFLFRWFILYPISKSVSEGAQTVIDLCLSKRLQNTTSEFFLDCKKFWKPPKANDSELRKAIWDLCEEAVEINESERNLFTN